MSGDKQDSEIDAIIELLESRKSANETKPIPKEVNLAEQIKNALKQAEDNDIEDKKDEATAADAITLISLVVKLMDSPFSKLIIAAVVAVCGFKVSTTGISLDRIKDNEVMAVAASKNLNTQVVYLTQLVQKLYTNGKLRDGQVEEMAIELARLENMNSLLLTKLTEKDSQITLEDLTNAGIADGITISQSDDVSIPVPIIKIIKPIETVRVSKSEVNADDLFKKINDSHKLTEKALHQFKAQEQAPTE